MKFPERAGLADESVCFTGGAGAFACWLNSSPSLILAILFWTALALSAQKAATPEQVLAKARDKIVDRTQRLPNYTCVQTVDRKYFKFKSPQFRTLSCDDMSANRKKKNTLLHLEATDRIRLDVRVSGGTEIGAWAGSSHFDDGNIMKLIKGPFGTGAFGTILTDIFTGDGVSFSFDGEEQFDSIGLLRYRFEVAHESSHYMVHAGDDWVFTGYDGAVWVDPNTFELRRLVMRTTELPKETGACESTTTVDYASRRVGDGDFLLPQRSTLHFLLRDMTESDVATTYSACHQYHAQANLVSDPAAIAGEASAKTAVPVSIPAGLVITIRLAEPIDTDTAAAGDVVVATVSAVGRRDPKAKTIVPVNDSVVDIGAPIRGRIVLMQHLLDPPRSFVVAIQLETLEIKGMVSPLYAIRPTDYEPWTVTKVTLEHRYRARPVFFPPRGQTALVCNFSYFTNADRYVMPRGYESQWTTVLP
jgi:hypothetical protein